MHALECFHVWRAVAAMEGSSLDRECVLIGVYVVSITGDLGIARARERSAKARKASSCVVLTSSMLNSLRLHLNMMRMRSC